MGHELNSTIGIRREVDNVAKAIRGLGRVREKTCYYSRNLTNREILILNRYLVTPIAKRLSSGSYQPNDLFSIGETGLIKAINSFEERNATEFGTYAVEYIEKEIHMYLSRNNSNISESTRNQVVQDSGENLDINAIDRREKVNEKDLKSKHVSSFLEKYVYAEEVPNDGIIPINKFVELVADLSEMEIYILVLSHGLISKKEKSCRQVATILGFQGEYVEATRKSCISKLQTALGLEKRDIPFNPTNRKTKIKGDISKLPGEVTSFSLPQGTINEYLESGRTIELESQGDVKISSDPTVMACESVEKKPKRKLKHGQKNYTRANRNEDVKVRKGTSITELSKYIKEFTEQGILEVCMKELSEKEKTITKPFFGILGSPKMKPKEMKQEFHVKQPAIYSRLKSVLKKFSEIRNGVLISSGPARIEEEIPTCIQKVIGRDDLGEYLERVLTAKQLPIITLKYGLVGEFKGKTRPSEEVAKELGKTLQNIELTRNRAIKRLEAALAGKPTTLSGRSTGNSKKTRRDKDDAQLEGRLKRENEDSNTFVEEKTDVREENKITTNKQRLISRIDGLKESQIDVLVDLIEKFGLFSKEQ